MENENNTDLAHWYVVYTYSGYENKVKGTLEKLVENRGMQDKIQEIIIPMEEEKLAIRKNIRILALDNLINTYTDALEDKELNLGPDERELAINIINEAREMLSEETQEVSNQVMQRPKWKKT